MAMFTFRGPSGCFVKSIRVQDDFVLPLFIDGRKSKVEMVDVETGKVLCSYTSSAEAQFVETAFIEGHGFVVVDDVGALIERDSRTNKERIILLKEDTSPVTAVAFCHENNLLMAMAGDVETVDHQEDDEDNIESNVIRIFDARGGSRRREIHSYEEMHSDSITTLHFLNNELLLSAGLDHLINCIDVQQGDSDLALISTQRLSSSISRLGHFPLVNGHCHIYGVTDDNCASIFRMNHREDVDLVLKRRACRDRTLIDLLSLDGDILAVESDVKGGVHVLQLSLDKQETTLLIQDHHHSDTVRCVAIDSRRRVIYTGGEDGLVKGRECLLDHDGHLVEKRIPSRIRHRVKPYEK